MAADSRAKFLRDAEKYVLQGKIQQAIGEYLKIVKGDPNDVLILNTVGDLYLRQGKSSEANKFFSQVAENYVKNNFFIKAIAVFKKILNSDPNNLEINSTVASLYAKQGLGIDARNQYLCVASLLEKEGRAREQRETYEKVVELDPKNAAIQRKLAELCLSEGAKEKSLGHWLGAARAQVKASDFAGAADSFGRAIQLSPLDVEAMRGFLECCLKLNSPASAIKLLKQSVDLAPENLDLRELLGQAHLANKEPETALKNLQVVISMDETRYGCLFEIAGAFIEEGAFDRAAECLDSIISTLISRRETGRAVQLYQGILQHCPDHIPTLVKLASIYSAIGDQALYLSTLDTVADQYIQQKNPAEALEYLEKILDANPTSEKHARLHQRIFSETYPGVPYTSPAEPSEAISVSTPPLERREGPEQKTTSEIVEIDLLINYGLFEKALGLLQNLEAGDPYDKEVRLRLLSIYKGERKNAEAAEQSLLLAVLHRRSNNEEAALSCLAEARQLSPAVAEIEKDLNAFARRNGIESGLPASTTPTAGARAPESEVDLSSDLLDIFFSGEQESTEEYQELNDTGEQIAESLPPRLASQASPKSAQEQLQEVDFYIRLGFQEEALAKLNEIAKVDPDNPELNLRYEKLGNAKPAAAEVPVVETVGESMFEESAPASAKGDELSELDFNDALDGLFEGASEGFKETEPIAPPAAHAWTPLKTDAPQTVLPMVRVEESEKDEFQANQMFADLMEETGAPSDDEILKESFEDHFSLGTAYRDMELNEEAIKEFQFALRIADLKKDARQIIQCCGMLSTCFLKKSMPSSALRWCQTGLKVKDISSHEATALRYDMGVAHSMSGSSVRALECFDQIFGLDPGYRDVAQKIDELRVLTGPKGGFDRHAP